jgi:F-type H+-transporting ATPase subunit delta
METRDIHDLDPTRAPSVFDVDSLRIAKVYAQALLLAALKIHPDQIDAIQETFDSLIGNPLATDTDPANVARMLVYADIPREKRQAAIIHALTGKAEDVFINFLLVLDKHGRLAILRPAAAMYRQLRDEYHKRVRVVVRTAAPLTDAQRATLKQLAEAYFKLKAILVEILEPELIGGLQVQIGDRLIDVSVQGRLAAIRNQLIERGTHEIQRRRDSLSPAV